MAVKNTKEAYKISQELGDEDLIIDTKLALANTVNLPEREQLGEELRSQLEQRNDLPRLNRILFRLMFTHLGRGNFEKCVETCDAGVEVAKKIGVPPVQYATIRALALIRWGRFDQARRSLEMEIADDDHRFGRAFRDTGYGIYYLEMLAFDIARETFESSIEQADQVGRAWLVNTGRFYLVRALLEGDLEGASEVEGILSNFDPSDLYYALLFGKQEYFKKNFVQALEFADQLMEFSKESGRRPELSSALLLRAESLTALEQYDEAISAADEGIQVARELEYLPILWRLLGVKAEALVLSDRKREAGDVYFAASQVIDKLSKSITDENIRQTFLSNPNVASIFAEAKPSTKEQV
jgi:tetratricopeptide (TPR) repeat protein